MPYSLQMLRALMEAHPDRAEPLRRHVELISALADQGIAYIYGALSEGDTPIPVLEMIPKMPTVKGYSIRLVVGDEARRKAAMEYVVKGLASGALRPVIDRTFKFDDMVEVHRYLENGGQFGKIVVTL